MWIEALDVVNFRNIAKALIRPSEGVNIFYGDNGSGKTNLLEAVFTLCLGRSQRGARDIMMVGQSCEGDELDHFRLEGIGHIGGHEVRLACAYQNGGRKKFTIDNNPVRLSRLYQFFCLVSMAPADVTILDGSPTVRRHFLDLYLSQASTNYLSDLNDYNKALAQKNSFLKNQGAMECPFDPLLVEHGSRIMAARHKFVHFLQALAPGYYQQIANHDDIPEVPLFSFAYKPNVGFENPEDIAVNFENKLVRYREREKILETAVVGPHRDDIEFLIGSFPARGYGSQGELRSAVIALLLASANFLESRRGARPILLLDEIFAELDARRRENLAILFEKFNQIFLTTAIRPPEIMTSQARIFHIDKGNVK